MKTVLIGMVHLVFFLESGLACAGGPLPVIYDENPEHITIQGESQQKYIDNQAYLQQFEKKRRERVLESGKGPAARVTTVETRRTNNPYPWQHHESPGLYGQDRRFFGIEYQSGSTTLRYYDGYQPNCCGPRTYYHRPPRPVPYSAVPPRERHPNFRHRPR